MPASRGRMFTRPRGRGRVLTTLLVTLSLLLQVGFQPTAKAATTVSMEFDLPQGAERTEIDEWVDTINDRDGLLSDAIKEEWLNNRGSLPVTVLGDWVDFDGTIAVRGSKLAFTLESDIALSEVSPWGALGIAIAGVAVYFSILITCTLFFLPESGPLAPLASAACSGIATFLSVFARGALTIAFEDNPDPDAWWNLLITSFVLGAAAAVWEGYFAPALNTSGAQWFSNMARNVRDAGRNIKSWWWAGNLGLAMENVGGTIQHNVPRYMDAIERAALRRGAPPELLRVMPLGDSITHGVGGTPGGVGYRGRLWDLLQDDANAIDFVGSVDSGHGNIPDTDHEGHPSWRISRLDSLASECVIARYRPNVVVLHIGTNDLANDEEPETAHIRLSRLVDRITDIAPLTTVLVSSLVPAKDEWDNTLIARYNVRLPTIVNNLRAEGKRVRLVNNGALGVTTADLADSLHPNNDGYRKMANAYHNAIKAAMNEGLIMPALPGDNRPCTPAPANPPPPPPTGPAPAGWNYVGKIASVPDASRAQVRFADLNGDGRDDYLLVGEQGQVKAWLNNRAGQGGGWNYIGEIATGAAPRQQVRFADVNGDGRDDYLSVGDRGQVSMWRNAGTGNAVSWVAQGVVATDVGATRDQVRFADVDVDGRDDYLVVDDQGRVRAWLNQFTGGGVAWSYQGEIASGVGATRDQVRFHDFDGDGRDDYLVFDDTGYTKAWLNNVGGNRPWIYQGAVVGGVGASRDDVVIADIDGNGRDDYLTVNAAGEVAAWLNERWGRADPWDYQGQIASTDAPRQEVRFADLNGDGRDDYLLVKDNGRVEAWLNVREADRVGWNFRGVVASGSGPRDHIRFADLNGDNRDDYLVVGDQGQVDAWFNSGTGDAVAWTSKGRLASGSASRDQIRFADIDGDNRDDYLVVDDQGRVRLWRNTGTRDAVSWVSQGEAASGVGATGPTVTFADVNGDRRDDYLVLGDHGQIRAWINNRGGSGSAWLSAGEVASGVGVARTNIGLAEINGDRRADYLVHDSRGGVKAWFNNGAGTTGTTGPMPNDPQPPPPGGLPLCVANRCW
ncbi:FG-GAP-like repeat-containing protein [Streptosporangium sp. NPDC049046]|uniref:FG-GAP-like repeat-containing protein n=1 Tax=Streptosporangium sp. NPDC049046 TaxID=3155031 RepID=UPI00341D370B